MSERGGFGQVVGRIVPAHLVFLADRRVKPGVKRAERGQIARPRDEADQDHQSELRRKHDHDLLRFAQPSQRQRSGGVEKLRRPADRVARDRLRRTRS